MPEQISEIENIGRKYKPDEVKLLYLAECPQSEYSHFYNTHAPIFRHIRESFQIIYKDCPSGTEFLDFFKEKKCYLLYLCYEPIAHLSEDDRGVKRTSGINPLSTKIRECLPSHIIMTMKKIEDLFTNAIRKSEINIGHVPSLPAGTSPSVIEAFKRVNAEILKRLHI